jgi:hypothetical protein
MLEELGKDLIWSSPLEILLTELCNPLDIGRLTVGVDRRECTTREGGEWVEVAAEDVGVREGVCNVLRTHWIPLANELARIGLEDLMQMVTPAS